MPWTMLLFNYSPIKLNLHEFSIKSALNTQKRQSVQSNQLKHKE